MKAKTIFLILCLFSIHAWAQDVPNTTDTIASGHKNVFKFLPVNMAFNSLSFEYERKFSPKSSLILGIGFPTPKPFASKFNLSSADNVITNDKFGSMAIRVAYRHYSGHHLQPVGFYYSPYLKYQKFTAKADNYRTDNSGVNGAAQHYNENYEVDANTMSFGLQLGWQFLIAKTVAIDFYPLGFEGGIGSVTATVKTTDATLIQKVYDNVQQNINDLPSVLKGKVTASKSASQVDVKGSSIPFPMLRSGISIGIAF